MNCSTPDFPVYHYLLELAQIDVYWVSDAIQPSHFLLPPSLPAINLSQHQGFFSVSALCIRWSKYWSFSPSDIHSLKSNPVLISFRIDWFDLLVVQGTVNSLIQHHNSKASILWHSAFFMVQLSRLYMTTGKTMSLITQSCLTLCDPMNSSPPDSSVHGGFPGKTTGVGCHAFLQGIFPTQGSNSGLPHCRWILYCLSHQGSPGKDIALSIWTFVDKVMFLLFTALSRFVTNFLLLISWLQALSIVILEPPKRKSAIVSIYSPSICHEMMRPDTMILV